METGMVGVYLIVGFIVISIVCWFWRLLLLKQQERIVLDDDMQISSADDLSTWTSGYSINPSYDRENFNNDLFVRAKAARDQKPKKIYKQECRRRR